MQLKALILLKSRLGNQETVILYLYDLWVLWSDKYANFLCCIDPLQVLAPNAFPPRWRPPKVAAFLGIIIRASTEFLRLGLAVPPFLIPITSENCL
ncbi:MAG: hypothetical protein B0W54_15405 [Cellvibrio sp. 79]|nr:MAG: hypothetical protein B0W54_15405 [Cellvibrio sp. 79]